MKYIALLITCFFGFNSFGQQNVQGNSSQFTVTADAILRVKPDQVVLKLGVESRGEDLKATKDENYSIIESAIKFCKEKGIQEKYLQTDYVRIQPYYRYNKDETQPEYYDVEQSLNIVLEDLDRYDELLTGLLKLGVNKVSSIDFRTTKMKESRYEARRMAIAAAKEKADFLAGEVDLELGRIINLSEYSPSAFNSLRSNVYANAIQNVAEAYDGESMDNTLSVGMISVKASVTLTYELEE